jgi:hypothetical protein
MSNNIILEENTMRNKAKKLTSIKSISVSTLVLLVVFGSALAARHYRVSGSGELDLSSAPHTGLAELTIGDNLWQFKVEVGSGKEISKKGDVTRIYDIKYYFEDLKGNTFSAIGDETWTPTNEIKVYRMSAILDITEGTEAFTNANGKLFIKGIRYTSSAEPYAVFEVKGTISAKGL